MSGQAGRFLRSNKHESKLAKASRKEPPNEYIKEGGANGKADCSCDSRSNVSKAGGPENEPNYEANTPATKRRPDCDENASPVDTPPNAHLRGKWKFGDIQRTHIKFHLQKLVGLSNAPAYLPNLGAEIDYGQ